MNLRQKLTAMTIGSVVVLGILFVFILQFQRHLLMDDRKDKVRNLVESAQTVVAYYAEEAKAGRLSQEEAQRIALKSLNVMRYDKVEYFFVMDMQGVMQMHPIKPELNGKNLIQMKDKAGKPLFEEMRNLVRDSGSGFVDYYWSKPNSELPAPKISYVQGFAPWGWFIGTGIYTDDVDNKFRESAVWLAGVGFLMALFLGGSLWKLSREILGTLGCEPVEAAAITQKISRGDLCVDIRVKAGDQRSLLADIQRMQETLRGMIRAISDNAEQVSSAAQQMLSVSEGVADRAGRQSESTSTMAASMEEMAVSVEHVRDSAGEAHLISLDAGSLADKGSSVIHNATAEMLKISEAVQASSAIVEELGHQSNQITSIVNTIKDIADQTNLLALNAAIEAARAGEQGRGFAVVADEVRKLAERTALSTTEIAGMVQKIQQGTQRAVDAMQLGVTQVGSGVELANQAGESINQIREGARKVTDVVNGISGSMQEQTTASHQVTQQISQIAEMTEENAAAIRDTAGAARHLQQLAVSLHQAVGQFKV